MPRCLFLPLLILGTVGCWKAEKAPFPTNATSSSAIVDGIEVRAVVSGQISFSPLTGDSFGHGAGGIVIRTARHRIVVEPERVTVDGTEVAKVPEGSRYLDLQLDAGGQLNLLVWDANGNSLATAGVRMSP
jgi:hypothetical protein